MYFNTHSHTLHTCWCVQCMHNYMTSCELLVLSIYKLPLIICFIVHTHTHSHTHTHTHTHTNANTHTEIKTHTHTHTQMRAHTHTQMYTMHTQLHQPFFHRSYSRWQSWTELWKTSVFLLQPWNTKRHTLVCNTGEGGEEGGRRGDLSLTFRRAVHSEGGSQSHHDSTQTLHCTLSCSLAGKPDWMSHNYVATSVWP